MFYISYICNLKLEEYLYVYNNVYNTANKFPAFPLA